VATPRMPPLWCCGSWEALAPSKPGSFRASNRVATIEVAKKEFEASWTAWKAWARLEELP
jgi:hypothetical protein